METSSLVNSTRSLEQEPAWWSDPPPALLIMMQISLEQPSNTFFAQGAQSPCAAKSFGSCRRAQTLMDFSVPDSTAPPMGASATRGLYPRSPSFAAISCLRPADSGQRQRRTLKYETLKNNSNDTANSCHEIGIRFTCVVFDSHVNGWTSTHLGHLDIPTSQLHLPHTRDKNLQLALFVTPP